MRLLFKGGHYYAQPAFFAAPIRGRRLFGVRRLFKEIRYMYIFITRIYNVHVHVCIHTHNTLTSWLCHDTIKLPIKPQQNIYIQIVTK